MGITRASSRAFITPYSKTKQQKFFKFAPRTFQHFGKIIIVCGQDFWSLYFAELYVKLVGKLLNRKKRKVGTTSIISGYFYAVVRNRLLCPFSIAIFNQLFSLHLLYLSQSFPILGIQGPINVHYLFLWFSWMSFLILGTVSTSESLETPWVFLPGYIMFPLPFEFNNHFTNVFLHSYVWVGLTSFLSIILCATLYENFEFVKDVTQVTGSWTLFLNSQICMLRSTRSKNYNNV